MKTLLLMRHAKSSWKFPDLSDHDRPLSKRGKRDAPRMGELLRDQGLTPEVILSSPAKRARKTAQAVAQSSHTSPGLELVRELYFGSPQDWLDRLKSSDASIQCLMLVGHNPGLEEFLELLTGQDEPLPTAAVACVDLPILKWEELSANQSGRLVHLWRPKELPH